MSETGTGPLSDPNLPRRCVAAIEDDVLPLTEAGVAAGNKVFGAALLDKRTLTTVIAETNNETQNPLWHGEIHLLKRFHERADLRGRPPGAFVFLSTHEPCPMCLSAITWAGFDTIVYFFTYEDSRDAFAIPHDLRIMAEVFGVADGAYRRDNAFWQARSVADLIARLPSDEAAELTDRTAAIRARYAALSATYQAGKGGNAIPLA